mgnify:CR=1 FL=1
MEKIITEFYIQAETSVSFMLTSLKHNKTDMFSIIWQDLSLIAQVLHTQRYNEKNQGQKLPIDQ